MTLTQRPFCTSQSSTSSNVLASCRAHSQVKSSNGSRSTMRGWEGTAPPITPTCDHAGQRKFSTVCDNSDLKSFSKFFMPNSVQYLFEFPAKIPAGLPAQQPIHSGLSLGFGRLQVQ